MATKIALKLLSLAERPNRTPEEAAACQRMAYAVDQAKQSLGDGMNFTSATYTQARRLYCKFTGRPWEWGQSHDLEWVDA